MSINNKWQALSMKDRAFLIREAVRNGITDINSIRDTWEHRFDGTKDNVPTEDEYIAQRAKEKIVEALTSARNRKETIQPYVEKSQKYKEGELEKLQMFESELDNLYRKADLTSKMNLSYNEFGIPKITKVIDPNIQERIHRIQDRVNKYKIECSKSHTHGPGCLATVMDDYGKTETWNKRFAQDPRKHGFIEIDQKDILPCDIVQFGDYYRDTETGAKTEWEPVHAMMANTPYHEIPKAVKYNGSDGGSNVRINSSYPVDSWEDNTKAFRFVGDKADSLQWKKEYKEKYGHQFSGKGSIIQRVLDLYNPWSSESMTAKASSPVVDEGLFDVNTARKAVIENDKEARKDLEAANALALTGSLVGASIVPSTIAAGASTGMAVPLLTAKSFKHKLASKAVSFIGSLIGGELINKAAEKQTGQTVGENIFNVAKPALPEKWQENPYINDYIGPIVGEFLNPAYPIGSRVIPNLGAKSIRGVGMATQEAKNAAKRTAEVIVRMGDEAHIPRSVRKQLINKETLSYIFNPKASKSAYNLPFKYSGQNAATHAAPAHPDDIVDVYFGKSDKLTAYSPDAETSVTIPVVTTSRTDSRLPEGARRWLEKNGKDEVKLLLLGDLPLSPVEVRQITRRITNSGSSPVYMGETSGAVKGALGESYIDPGGFNRIVRRNGNIVEVNDFDIWKFTAPEYEKKYFGPRMLLEDYSGPTKFHQWKKFMGDALQRRLKNLGLNFIDKQGTPIVTMWTSDFPYPENLTSTPIVDYDAIKAGTDYNQEALSILKDILKSKK